MGLGCVRVLVGEWSLEAWMACEVAVECVTGRAWRYEQTSACCGPGGGTGARAGDGHGKEDGGRADGHAAGMLEDGACC